MPEETSPFTCPSTISTRRNPHRRARPTPVRNISAVPRDDIVDEPPITTTTCGDDSVSLKVFLRVRPLPTVAKRTSKSKALKDKVLRPSAPKSCITVNDIHSVTVIPPNCDSNRSKSEVFAGFSHVFGTNSSQDEVYETMMRPIVEEFLEGRSGLLAALGPSGSGKTHTVFGSVKDPGLVPRALHHMFDSDVGNRNNLLRSFYLSVFEICSEKGKGEKLYDLSPDGADISMQQSVVRGLKEVLITDVAQAESILANAKSKRATAFTNSNSQSSRSQCIINIRYAIDETTEESTTPRSGAVLTFVDLAGAEREKKTWNQGGRLLESNFINNTSMVFGLCLRSLLEHQKNPKKPLQKHFQSSLLTRYLRDYLEGRKRMALILTTRCGPEDYFDISFLLRQASPYMEIKFNNVDETSDLPGNKRRSQNTCTEQQKRVKLSEADDKIGRGRKPVVFSNVSREEADFSEVLNQDQIDCNLEESKSTLTKTSNADINLPRHYHFMLGFAKACWSILKQYKERVKAMQNEIDALTENTRIEHDRYLVIEKELQQLQSQCSCQKQDRVLAICSGGEVGESSASVSEAGFTQNDYDTALPGHPQVVGEKVHLEDPPSISKTSLLHDEKVEPSVILRRPFQLVEMSALDLEQSAQQNHQQLPMKTEHSADPANNWHEKDLMDEEQNELKGADLSSLDLEQSTQQNHEQSPLGIEHPADPANYRHEKNLMDEDQNKLKDATAYLRQSLVLDVKAQGECYVNKTDEKDNIKKEEKEIVASVHGSNLKTELETKKVSSHTSSQEERPKRRLMPASSLLLRDVGNLDVIDENVKHRGRGGQRKVEDEGKRSRGNASLLRLLKNHLPR